MLALSLAPGCGGVFLIMSRDLPLFLVAGMDIETVTKGDAVSGRDLEVAGARRFLFELVNAERVRGEQSVVAHVPPGGMTLVLRMIEDRDTDRFAVDRTGVIDPLRALAPGRVVAHAFAV